MEHLIGTEHRFPSGNGEPGLLSRCIEPLDRTFARLQRFNEKHGFTVLVRIVGILAIVLFSVAPVAITGSAVVFLSRLAWLGDNVVFWVVSSLALALASAAPALFVLRFIHSHRRATVRHMMSNVDQRDPEMWRQLDARMASLRRELVAVDAERND